MYTAALQHQRGGGNTSGSLLMRADSMPMNMWQQQQRLLQAQLGTVGGQSPSRSHLLDSPYETGLPKEQQQQQQGSGHRQQQQQQPLPQHPHWQQPQLQADYRGDRRRGNGGVGHGVGMLRVPSEDRNLSTGLSGLSLSDAMTGAQAQVQALMQLGGQMGGAQVLPPLQQQQQQMGSLLGLGMGQMGNEAVGHEGQFQW